MKNFNFKQWLIDNKSGMYSKTSLKEALDPENGFADDNLNRGDMYEINPASLGIGQATADAEMQMQDDETDQVINEDSSMRVDLLRTLYAEKRYSKDMLLDLLDEALSSMKDSDVKMLYDKVKSEIADYEEREYPDYADYGGTNETVGYVMKTKSPEDKQFFPGNNRR